MEKKKVLIIDDDKAIVSVTRLALDLADFEVDVAYNGPDGLAKARDFSPDFILLDIMMPDMDGWTVLSRLKEDIATRAIPVAMFTALGERTDIVEIIEKGAVDYITKPYEPEDLVQRIKVGLGLKD